MDESPAQPVRIVTAAALFDGHDAAINLVRRLLVAHGAQVIHLGHDRGVAEIVKAAVEEDADAVCVSSYQGGHEAFFGYLVERLRAAGAGAVKVFGGGGGVSLPEEIARLEAAGVEKLYTPDDGTLRLRTTRNGRFPLVHPLFWATAEIANGAVTLTIRRVFTPRPLY